MSVQACIFRPLELRLGRTKVIIVDPHNEILPYWFHEYLNRRERLVAVRIDEHHDMFHQCPALPAREGRDLLKHLSNLMPHIREYSQRKVNEGNFTCPAFHYGVLGALYHFNPRERKIDAYGRVLSGEFVGAPKTKEEDIHNSKKRSRWIFWDGPTRNPEDPAVKSTPIPQVITLDEFKRDLDDSPYPAVIGFDLDSLYGLKDKGDTKTVVDERLKRVRQVVESVSAPEFVCIARSQNPRTYVPPEVVDHLQSSVLGLVENIYG